MAQQIHLLDAGDGTRVLTLNEINRQIAFDSGYNAIDSTYTKDELLSMDQIVFESDAEVMIENAIAAAPTSTEAERIFKAELIMCKAIISDKSYNSEI